MKVAARKARPFADVVLTVGSALAVLPVVWMVVLSLQPGRNIVSPEWDFSLSWDNYAALLAPGEPFIAQLLNSVLIVLGSVALCLALGALSGYSLSQLRLPRAISVPLLGCAAVLPLIPPMTLVPGLYVTLNNLGLLGSVAGLICVNTLFNLPFTALLLKVYFDAVPGELRESALMDGASEGKTFLLIMLPLVRGGLSAAAVFTAIMTWNEFLMGLTMTTGGETAPLTVGIAALVQPYSVSWGPMAAAGTLAAIPIITITLVANRQIVAGLTRGAVKG